jgi:nucleotide-binding universal stress UspA family protein
MWSNRDPVVVGVDGAEPGWRALAWAVAEAASLDARLVICRAVDPHGRLAAARPGLLELADPPLARAVAGAKARLGGDLVSLTLPTRAPVAALLEAAADARLLVVGAPDSLDRAGAGATTRKVAAHAPCPVAVVRPVRGGCGPFAGHVVVAVDGGVPALAALEFGFSYADRHHVPLAAVHVTWEHAEDVWVDDTLLETHLVDACEDLTGLDVEVEPWRHKYPNVATRRAVFSGLPAAGLLRAARGARLLVLGATRASAVLRPLGSVSRSLIGHATGPLVVVRDGPGAAVQARLAAAESWMGPVVRDGN